MSDLNSVERFAALRGRAIEVQHLASSMANADTVEAYDRAYDRLCKLLEPIGERLDMCSMEERGFVQSGPDTWTRKNNLKL